jgi:hypothetical protein
MEILEIKDNMVKTIRIMPAFYQPERRDTLEN